jgi:SecD/SecF fusion protein
MRRFLPRILVCLVPTFLALVVVGWAYYRYEFVDGGGFRLGVDLVGGTILVYEIDETKTQEKQFNREELAAALKRRVDPNDLYNVTIRPIGDTRVEIILPTGGQHQMEIENRNWENLLAEAATKFPVKGQSDPYKDIDRNDRAGLVDLIAKTHPDIPRAEIDDWVEGKTRRGGKERRSLTGDEVERIKGDIARQGRLEFRIVANQRDDRAAFAAAQEFFKKANKDELRRLEVKAEPPPAPRRDDGSEYFPVELPNEPEHSYSWVELGKAQLYGMRLNNDALAKDSPYKEAVQNCLKTGEPFPIVISRESGAASTMALVWCRDITDWSRRLIKDRELGKKREFFILCRNPIKGQEITGDYLVRAAEGRDRRGGFSIEFTFNPEGGNLFWDVTSRNKPSGGEESGFKRQLAILFDGQVVSAPNLISAIRTNGQITGDFTQQEVNDMVRILRAGALPATLKKDPVSENSMGPTLGAVTIKMGTISVVGAFVAVMVFMLFYYRFAGLVACTALFVNLLLTVAFMVLVQAAFTLPGLAGLVLTLGMAVDANVLIYERLREERERGANLGMAIRNGYDRAFPTILDTHLSSIFTAIVLYVVGNDQLKGFGISLTMGLIISLFTSLYMTRLMFDMWLAKGGKDLGFYDGLVKLIHSRYWDFMSVRYIWFTATVGLTIVGGALFLYRTDSSPGKATVLNIDFTGGIAYTGELNQEMSREELHNVLDKDANPLPDLSIEPSKGADGTVNYVTLRTSYRTDDPVGDLNHVLAYISKHLEGKLKIHKLKDFKLALDAKKEKATGATLAFMNEDGREDYVSPAFIQRLITDAFHDQHLPSTAFSVDRPEDRSKRQGKEDRFSELRLTFSEPLPVAAVNKALAEVELKMAKSPQPERLERFDKALAASTRERALYAILASWLAILLYLWFRFGSWTFGAATVLCLIHDLFFTLGVIAVCHYIHDLDFTLRAGILFGCVVALGATAYVLGARGIALGASVVVGAVLALTLLFAGDFKIDLQAVAALLTLVGYSVNDTIVVFDRIREVRGKNPALTPQMINDSVNQTLTRTILASATVFIVVLVLYVIGGEGVKLFAFVMIVGVIVGTYSSIYIASPLLLIFGEGRLHEPARADRAPQAAITKG